MDNTEGCAVFQTAIGVCGIAWGPGGILGIQLPEGDEVETRARLSRRFAGAVERAAPAKVARAMEGMTSLLAGAPVDLWAVVLDMEGIPGFDRRVYAVARTIRAGATMTYGELAERVGDARAARAVGQALGNNPFPIIVPCHRVLAANGRTGGFSGAGGIVTKLKLLTIERAETSASPMLFDHLPLAVRSRRG